MTASLALYGAAQTQRDGVVLSACITIAGDGPEAEALSGVARSFDWRRRRALTLRCA